MQIRIRTDFAAERFIKWTSNKSLAVFSTEKSEALACAFHNLAHAISSAAAHTRHIILGNCLGQQTWLRIYHNRFTNRFKAGAFHDHLIVSEARGRAIAVISGRVNCHADFIFLTKSLEATGSEVSVVIDIEAKWVDPRLFVGQHLFEVNCVGAVEAVVLSAERTAIAEGRGPANGLAFSIIGTFDLVIWRAELGESGVTFGVEKLTALVFAPVVFLAKLRLTWYQPTSFKKCSVKSDKIPMPLLIEIMISLLRIFCSKCEFADIPPS